MSGHRVPIGRKIAEGRWLLFRIRSMVDTDFDRTRKYVRSIGVRAGEGTIIYPSVQFGSEPWLVSVGENTWLTAGVEFVTHDGSITVVRNGPYGVQPGERVNRFG